MIELLNEYLKGLEIFSIFKDMEPAVYNSKIVKGLIQKVSEDNAKEMLSPGILMATDVLRSFVGFTVDRQIRISPVEKYHQMWGSQLGEDAAEITIWGSYKFEWNHDEKSYWGKMIGEKPTNKEEFDSILVNKFTEKSWYHKYKLRKIDDCWYFLLNKESDPNDDFGFMAEYSFIVDVSKCSPGYAEVNFALEFSLDWDEV